MLDEIIEKYCNNSLFINIDNIEPYLLELSIESRNKLLKEIFNYNKNIYKELKKQNEEYLKILNSNNENLTKPVNKINKVKNSLYKEDDRISQVLNIDISFYLDCMSHMQNLSELDEFLPDKANENYTDIINSILIKLLEEKVIIQRLMKETKKEDPDMIYYKEELTKVLEKINYIKNYNNRITVFKENFVKKTNHIIFLNTNALNNCFMNDILKNIDEHYYGYVKDLLESIKYGSFKNVKSFTGNDKLTGLFEVKLSQVRIIFRRLQPGVYVVVQVLIKKFQQTHQYHTSMIARNNLYNSNEPYILSRIKDKEYLDYNDNIYNDLINYLDVNRKGDSNGRVNRKHK